MNISSFAVVVVAVAWVNVLQPGITVDRDGALNLFRERVDAYAALHRQLEAPLLTLTRTRDMRRNFVARQLLATAIRKARAQAHQGDVFSPEVAFVLRAVITKALAGRDVETFLAELNEEHPETHHLRAVVNEPLPRGTTHEVPVSLLLVLPELPEDVEYRIVNHDLVLWDIHADLVVDFLPNAFRAVELTLLW